ncbi:hypothetical protein QFC21_005449 [Naganishia friedmannii]|uniref:Uncharacterized protein n=1 Tax=Naganishia friedmannii TaxID=89922 RepID=A0ACC2V9M7_9TREE|nr:hypothetical protein QFC21_005449 [Naganishia friedmannii]
MSEIYNARSFQKSTIRLRPSTYGEPKAAIVIDSPKPVKTNILTKLVNGKAAASIPKQAKKPAATIAKKKINLDSDSETDFDIEDSVAADDSIMEDFDIKPAKAVPARTGRGAAKVYAELSDDDF